MSVPTEISSLGNGSARSQRYRVRGSDFYQSLLCRLQSMDFGVGGEHRSVGLTSCARGEGVTTVASNLAVHAAHCTEARILIVDANLANPSLHKTFKLSATPGLADAIGGNITPEESIQQSGLDNLSVVTSGIDEALAARPILPLDGVCPVFESFRTDFDLIIVDLPALDVPTNLSSLTSKLDGVLVVLAAEGISVKVAERQIRQTTENGTELLGVVFNKRRRHLPWWIDRIIGV